MKKSDISIIILLYNTPKDKIQNLLNYKDFNIFILDQSDDHVTKKKIKKILPKIRYYKVSKQNNGFAKGINFLSKKIKTKFFLCTQIDVLINTKSIMGLKKAFIDNDDCIISVPNFKKLKRFNKYSKSFTKVKRFIGAIFLTDTFKFNKIGRFDENFFFYWEDEDLSKRIDRFDNFNIYKCNNSYAKHYNGKSSINNDKSKFIRLSNFKFGEYLFQYKYKKLKKIKMFREPIKRFFLLLIFIIFLNKNKFYNNLYYLVGIFKFYKFICFNKIS